MAKKLLFPKLKKTLHIALFCCISLISASLNAQSVLLPGDVVMVSASSDVQSIDLIPLIDVEEGTQLYFSVGRWDDSTQTLTGEELKVTFLNSVEAGTNLHINKNVTEAFEVEGELELEGETHRLFAYQKEEGIYRHIFALGWGEEQIWKTTSTDTATSDVPTSLKADDLYVSLGSSENHQYYIRNGASGTRELLLSFVRDEENWRASENPFPPFGTSFNLLKPPVVLFDESISFVDENDSSATLNVAIYEHDGSRLTVDVVFDSLQSIIDSDDIQGFTSETLNFTGLIGNAKYKVEIPVHDDSIYEGRETGIFKLENLSKGNFGDFLTHSLVIQDDEQPNVQIYAVTNNRSEPDQIELLNAERGVVSLNGWSLVSSESTFTFGDDAVIYPNAQLKVLDRPKIESVDTLSDAVYMELERPILRDRGGSLKLVNVHGDVIDVVNYDRISAPKSTEQETRRESLNTEARPERVVENVELKGPSVSTQVTLARTSVQGWKIVQAQTGLFESFPETEWVAWDSEEVTFKRVTDMSALESSKPIVFGYFETDQAEKLTTWAEQNRTQEKADGQTLTLQVSATDVNENGRVDQLEGLNLALNSLERSISVYNLKQLISDNYPELNIEPAFYGFSRNQAGDLDMVALTDEDSIAARAPFWMLLENMQEPVKLVIPKEELLQEMELVEEAEAESTERSRVALQVSVVETDRNETLQINFGDFNENKAETIKDLESYPALQLGKQSYFQAAFSSMDEFYKTLSVTTELSSTVSIPIYFNMNGSGSVRMEVAEWENIPAEWSLVLEDRLLDKEYDLRESFSLNFEHNGEESQARGNEEKEEETVDTNRPADRFVVHVSPPGSENQQEEEAVDAPRELELHQNFPNPFNPITTISFYLPESQEVKLSVFNIVGQPISVIVNGTLSAGEKHFEWDASDRPSGMYIYQLEVGNKVMTRKMTLVK